MKIYNSYNDRLEEFKPNHDKQVNMYVCGPTVYNYIHIGNARPVVFFDTVRRFFEYQGYQVTYVSNFTDVDDKIIQKAIAEGKDSLDIANRYIDAYLSDLSALNCRTDYVKPRVTEYMNHIVTFIDQLVKEGYAYQVNGDVYFSVEKIKDYGCLSNRRVEDLKSGARIEINEDKQSPLDFTLWKETEVGVTFDSPFSKGRPGWHTECVAMIDDIFHEKIDIHGGGSDLKFPHHENEIAQSLALNHHRLANYWMHNGRLSFQNAKMSKSLGNVIFVKDVREKMALRYFLLSTHYRSPLNYDEEGFSMYVKEFEKLESSVKQLYRRLDLADQLKEAPIENDELLAIQSEFVEAMSNDFNTANAITALQSLIKQVNKAIRGREDIGLFQQMVQLMNEMMGVLGLKVDWIPLQQEDKLMYREWEEARKQKDFSKADSLRAELMKRGIV